MEEEMKALFAMIEDRIRASGYPKKIDGEAFFEDVCQEAEDKENGTYIFILKKDEEISYQGCMTISDEDMDLHYVDIFDGEMKYHVDFDC